MTAADAVGATATHNFSVTINSSGVSLAITTASLANWTVNHGGYSQTVATIGGTGSDTFSVTAGTLPTGLTLTSAGVLSGTPKAVGTYSFTVTVTDGSGDTASASYVVTIYPPITVAPLTLPDWTINQPGYKQKYNILTFYTPLRESERSKLLT